MSRGRLVRFLFVLTVGTALAFLVGSSGRGGAQASPGLQGGRVPGFLAGPTEWTTATIAANTTWTAMGSPYLVRVNVTVNSGVTLTVEPGVVVKFDSGKSLLSIGTLLAIGNSNQPIVFTSINDPASGGATGNGNPQPGDWMGVTLKSNASRLEYAEVRYAGDDGGGMSAAVEISGYSSPFITPALSHVIIWKSKGSGIGCSYAAPLISYVTVSETVKATGGMGDEYQGDGLHGATSAAASCVPTIRDSVFLNNAGRGIYVKAATAAATVSGNRVQNNGGDGIVWFANTAPVTITDNTVNGQRTGVGILHAWATVRRNTLNNNRFPLGVTSYISATYDANVVTGNTYNQAILLTQLTALDYLQGTLLGSAHLPAPSTVYVISGTTPHVPTVGNGLTLTIEPGAVIKFAASTDSMVVYGTLLAQGNDPIVFTSLDDNSVGGMTGSGAPQPGDWQGIRFSGGSSNSILDHVEVRYGGRSTTCPAYCGSIRVEDGAAPTIRYSTIVSSYVTLSGDGVGIAVRDSNPTIVSNTIGYNAIGIYAANNVNPLIHYNYFHHNTRYAVQNVGSNCIDARWNYWGDADGPDDDGATVDACGLGMHNNDAGQDVSNNVNYSPWLTSLPLHHFAFTPIAAQTVGVPFAVTVTARDAADNVVTAYYNLTLNDTTGTVVPAQVELINGTATVDVIIRAPGANVSLAAQGDGISGSSNPFPVVALAWEQANSPGFGNPANWTLSAMAVFNDYLYVGTLGSPGADVLWRSPSGDPGTWTRATDDDDIGTAPFICDLATFENMLYAAVCENNVARIYRSAFGEPNRWQIASLPGFDNDFNNDEARLAVYKERLYAATVNPMAGLEVWRSQNGWYDWQKVVDGGFGNPDNIFGLDMAIFGDYLYLGVLNNETGGQLWRSASGDAGDWEQVVSDGFDSLHPSRGIWSLAAFDGYLYAGTLVGAQLWRSATGAAGSWTLVTSDGFGGTGRSIHSLAVFQGHLYAGIEGEEGARVWQGNTWLQANLDGFQNISNTAAYVMTPFHGRLYVGTQKKGGSPLSGAELWRTVPSLATHSDVSFIGERAVDRAGYAAAGIGDFNGDGYDDFVVGAPFSEEFPQNEAGRVYFFSGRSWGRWQENLDIAQADTILLGQADADRAGWSAAGAGDVNGDGYDDFLVGAPDGNSAGPGKVYLILGRATDMERNVPLVAAAAVTFTGQALNSNAGYAVAGAGDVNADGYADFLIGAPGYNTARGKVYLLLGKANWQGTVSLANADAAFLGAADGDLAGSSVAGAGDVNGDGYADFLIGAPHHSSGQAYLVLGRHIANWGTSFSLTNADASFSGQAGDINAGWSVAGAGDVNGDGLADMLISAPGGSLVAGNTYLLLGCSPANWGAGFNLGSADAVFVGELPDDNAGWSVAGAGDVNGDGYDDFLIGARDNDETAIGAGKAYLLYGRAAADWGRAYALARADGTYLGEAAWDGAGDPLAAAGDVNGDGLADFLIGAKDNNEGGPSAGELHLILGRGVVLLNKASTAIVEPGDRLDFNVTLQNTGDATVHLVLTNTLPHNIDYIQGSASATWGGEQSGGLLTWRGYLAPLQGRSFAYHAQVVDDAVYHATIENAVTLDDGRNPPRTITVTTVVSSLIGLPDLAVQSVFVRPPVVHAGTPAGIGARFVNATRHPLRHVPVAFFDGAPSLGGSLIATMTIPLLYRQVVTWTGMVWDTSGLQGLHDIYVVVDYNNRFTESDESNNVQVHTVRVRPFVTDTMVPTGTITIAGGAQTTSVPTVTLALSAQDAGGSGLRSMRLVAYTYDSALHRWTQRGDSGWIAYAAGHNWVLTEAGVSYILAWFRDGAGNVSWPAASDFINFIPASTSIGAGQWRLYRLAMVANRVITVTVTANSGDPDLFVWYPASNRWPDVVAMGPASERVTFRAPHTGIYQIGVWGQTNTNYGLTIGVGWASAAASLPSADFVDAGMVKYVQAEPPVNTDNFPLGEDIVMETECTIYLPLVLRKN